MSTPELFRCTLWLLPSVFKFYALWLINAQIIRALPRLG